MLPFPFALLASLLLAAASANSIAGWNVSNTGQPYTEAEITVEEGTWMSLTVSPDGATIVFDLLGDLYRIPAEGGRATLIHGGPAMQRSPRFSPDGRELLYLSDESGSDNLWISAADGSNPRQVTHETVDIPTAPTWGPAGRYVAAARFEATFPKLRASEIYLYDLAGGQRRVLVEGPANGRDVQEANFARDGRTLYYTEKVSNPELFVDANHIHHVIKRRDLESGETETLIGGFGGATTPQVSPDGLRLAFVRRVRDQTVLFVYDTQTRTQRPVYAELDRDVQADFVPHGHYYPAFDWFPDNIHVAIWGKGRLFRINVDTQEVTEIPFQATARHRFTHPPQVTLDLAPEHVTARALRQLAVTPDGGTLVFHALGYLWRQTLPKGSPTRLSSTTAFEFEPAFSADGRELAYVEWDDQHGASLKIMTLRTGRTKTVARSAGVIREPSFAPDGTELVFRVEDGNKIMGGYRARGGIYRVASGGGEVRFVTKTGTRPTFSPDGLRIFYSHIADRTSIYTSEVSVTALSSVNLEGLDRRDHALGPDTSELRVSPDLRWITFRQHQQLFVVPYHETGHPLVLHRDSKDVPVARLTRISGFDLTWAGQGGVAYWLLGPEVYRADVARGIRDAAAGTRPDPAPYARVRLDVPTDVPSGALALVHGRIITMEDEEVIEDGTVVVERNRIVAVGPADAVHIPDGARVIDITGKTVMPGLIDMHGHIDCCYPSELMPQQQPARYAAAAFGITTNFDPYSSELPNYASTEMTTAGIIVGPRFIGSGQVVYGRTAKPDFTYDPIDSYQDALDIMTRKQALGGQVVKSYKLPMRSQRQQLVRAGFEKDILIDAEGENHFYNNITMVLDGHSILEHNLPIANYYDDIIQLMAHGHVANTPTLVVTFGEIFGENFLYQNTRAWEDPRIRAFVQDTVTYSPLNAPRPAPPHVRGMTTVHVADEIYDIGFRAVSRSIRRLDEAGVLINAGSHGQISGLTLHWEMWLLAEGGMANHRILRTATINGAESLGVKDQIGSLAPGKLADLIVLDGNPLQDIRDTTTVRYTMINGRLYDAHSMDEIGNHPRPRKPFYWERPDYKGIDWNEAWSGQ